MKKYFLFDNEAITGWNYLWRFLIGSILIALFGLGLWIIAATTYKRSGSFEWTKTYRIIASILIPFLGISNILSNDPALQETPFNLFDAISFALGLLHLILLVKNGNKHCAEV